MGSLLTSGSSGSSSGLEPTDVGGLYRSID